MEDMDLLGARTTTAKGKSEEKTAQAAFGYPLGLIGQPIPLDGTLLQGAEFDLEAVSPARIYECLPRSVSEGLRDGIAVSECAPVVRRGLVSLYPHAIGACMSGCCIA